MSPELLSFLIHWVPTILFVVGILFATFWGFVRGFRKSVILCIHAFTLGLILLIVFLAIGGKTNTDENAFKIVQTFVGEGTVQNAMGVSSSCDSFTDCFIEFIPKNMDRADAFELVLKENGQYLATLASLAARLVIALLLWIVYLVGIFILYLVYLIFYPVRRYIKKKKREYEAETKRLEAEESSTADAEPEMVCQYDENGDPLLDENGDLILVEKEVEPKNEAPKSERPPFKYNKRRGFGALVGGLRKTFAGIIWLSILGSLLFILAGGNGQKEMESMDWGNDDTNLAYGAYSEIATYGTTGIYKVLNAFHDKENTPYYLFAADLIFRGDLVDEEREINQNVILREELGTYTAFTKDTVNLILKYGSEEIRTCITSGNTDGLMDVIISILQKEEVRTEFTRMIKEFKASTYFVNLSYSLISSVVNHLEELGLAESLGDNAQLIQLLFKKGYFAEKIPYEKYLKDNNSTEVLAYFTPDIILNNNDAATLVNMALDIIPATKNTEDQTLMVLNIADAALGYLTDLTILSSETQANTDKVFARLYQFILNTYFKKTEETTLTALSSGVVENPYEDTKFAKISWVSEIKNLISCTGSILSLYKNVYEPNEEILNCIMNIFDTSNAAKYEKNMELYADIQASVGNSFLLGDILAGEYGQELLENGLSSFVPGLELGEIQYSNVKDDAGNLVKKGEFYYLLEALKAFASQEESRNFLTTMIDGGVTETDDYYQLVKDLATGLTKADPSGSTALDSVLDSQVFTKVFSKFLISAELGDFNIYVDESIIIKDEIGRFTNVIEKAELKTFFTSIISLLNKLIDVGSTADTSTLLNAILSQEVYDALDSKIIEGTLSSIIADKIKDIEIVVVPKKLSDGTGYISTEEETSEIKNLIGLFHIEGLDISKLTDSYADSNAQTSAIINMLSGLTEQGLNDMLNSKIIYYTMSKYMIDHKSGFLGNTDLIIPSTVIEDVAKETITKAVKKTELANLFYQACKVLPEDMGNVDLSQLVNKITKNNSVCDNLILSASITNILLNSDVATNMSGLIVFPTAYQNAGTAEELDNYSNTNAAYIENKAFMKSLGILIGPALEGGLSLTSESDKLSETVYKSFSDLNEVSEGETETNLEIVYTSTIMAATITNRIDEVDIIDADMQDDIKEDGIYKKEEISSLVNLVSIFELDLSNPNIATDALDSALLNKLLETKDGETRTNLEIQYDHKITGLMLTKGIRQTQTDEIIPTDALVDGEKYITIEEAKAMIQIVDDLALDINNFSVGDTLSIQSFKNRMYDEDGNIQSRIILQTVSEKLIDLDVLVIPKSAMDSDNHGATRKRLLASEALAFFNGAGALGVDNLNSDIDSTPIPDDDTKIATIASSSILRATISEQMEIDVNGTPTAGKVKNETSIVTVEKNVKDEYVAVLAQAEIENLLKSINILLDDTGTITNISINLTQLQGLSSADKDTVLSSAVLAPIISDAIAASGTYTIKTGDSTPPEAVAFLTLATKTVSAGTLYTAAQMKNYLS